MKKSRHRDCAGFIGTAKDRFEEVVELPVSLWAKVLLLNEMVRQQVRPVELARKLGTSAQDVNRLVNLKHTTKVGSIQEALSALGKKLDVGVS